MDSACRCNCLEEDFNSSTSLFFFLRTASNFFSSDRDSLLEEVDNTTVSWNTFTASSNTASRNEPTNCFRAWTESQEELRIKKLAKHFDIYNWSFPLLLGSQHNNRFKRNTKVYMLSGTYEGRHRTVVGHGTDFNLKRWGSELGVDPFHFTDNWLPLLKVLWICPTFRVLEIRDIHQDTVKLVDLQNPLDFALPALSPWNPVEKYNYLKRKWRK